MISDFRFEIGISASGLYYSRFFNMNVSLKKQWSSWKHLV
ncbi:unnamed protein product [Arabidopsis lyrata]|nr:unnamed protein product [Arabidopsis lyrata]